MGTHAHCVLVDMAERLFEFCVLRPELSWTEVLRVVAPVAVRTDPDLEQRRLVLLDRPGARGGERADARSGPHERVAEREFDLALPPRPFPVYEAFPERRRLALLHPGTQLARGVFHRGGCDRVGD